MMKGMDEIALEIVKYLRKKQSANKRPKALLLIASVAISLGMLKVVLTQECRAKKVTAINARIIIATW